MKKQVKKRGLKFVDVVWILSVITIVGGWINPYIILVAVPCMFAPVIAGLVANKTSVVCSSTCGRGSFLIKIWKKVSLKKPMPKVFNATWFKWVATIALLGMFTNNVIMNLILREGDFLTVKLWYFSLSMRVMINVTGLIALVVGFIYKPKTWCVFCPMGNVGKVLGKGLHKK